MKDTLIVVACIIILAMLAFIAWQFVVPTQLLHAPAPVACTLDAKECPDGSYVGRVGPDCAFAACPDTVQYSDVPSDIVCTEDMRQAEACIEIYAPVCGLVQVQCVTTPCEPIPETFSNGCFACANKQVISYREGACEGSAL